MSRFEIEKEISKLSAAISKHKKVKVITAGKSKNMSLVSCGSSNFLKSGNSLVRVGTESTKSAETKTKTKFSKSKNKTLIKDSSGTLYSKIGNSIVKNSLKKKRKKSIKKSRKHCQFFRFGNCKGNCRYIHDPTRISPCPKYLLGLDCSSCKLNHSPTPFITPNCRYYELGNCNRSGCRFLHIKHANDATICSVFADSGYCPLGSTCNNLHVFSCPRFEKDGKCTKKGCKLKHVSVRSVEDNVPIMPDFTADSSDTSDSSPDGGESEDVSEQESEEEEEELEIFQD